MLLDSKPNQRQPESIWRVQTVPNSPFYRESTCRQWLKWLVGRRGTCNQLNDTCDPLLAVSPMRHLLWVKRRLWSEHIWERLIEFKSAFHCHLSTHTSGESHPPNTGEQSPPPPTAVRLFFSQNEMKNDAIQPLAKKSLLSVSKWDQEEAWSALIPRCIFVRRVTLRTTRRIRSLPPVWGKDATFPTSFRDIYV